MNKALSNLVKCLCALSKSGPDICSGPFKPELFCNPSVVHFGLHSSAVHFWKTVLCVCPSISVPAGCGNWYVMHVLED